MGDKRRFDLFARLIARHVPDRNTRIADVAAGRGYLTWALKEQGFTNVVPFEPAPRKGGQVRRLGMHVRCFEPRFAHDFDLLVGMHPDQATDCILSGAALTGTMAIVVPCCVRPTAWTYWGSHMNFARWVEHLQARTIEAGKSVGRAIEIRQTTLPMIGRNLVMLIDSSPL